MAVSTATYDWVGGSGTLVGAVGTCDEVLSEIANGIVSSATLENKEHLMAWGITYDTDSSTTIAGAMWYSQKTATDWA